MEQAEALIQYLLHLIDEDQPVHEREDQGHLIEEHRGKFTIFSQCGNVSVQNGPNHRAALLRVPGTQDQVAQHQNGGIGQ